MEKNKYQSFLSCIADVYEYVYTPSKNRNKIVSLHHTTEQNIDWIKNIIINHLSLDNFVTFQNGTLVDIFYNPTDDIDINMAEHEHTKLYIQFT